MKDIKRNSRETCQKPFGFLVIDHREAQDYLNSMAARGWEVVDLRFGMLKFRRTERTDLRYFIDWTDPQKGEEEDYLQLCEEDGWALQESLGYWNLFASRPGTYPVPIQTDPQLEYERYRKKVLRRMLIGAIPSLLLLLLLGVLIALGSLPSMLMSGNLMVLLALASPLLLPVGATYVGYSLSRLLAWKKALRAGTQPTPSAPGWQRFWFGCRLLGQLYRYILFTALLADILLNGLFTGLQLGAFTVATLFFLAQDMERRPKANRHWTGAVLVVAAIALCFFLRGPARAVFPGRIPQWPILENAWLDPGRPYTITPERWDTLLASQAHWIERVSSLPDPDSSISEDMLRMEIQIWATPALGTWAFGDIPPEMEPLPGYEGVWAFPNSYGVDYLIRRGGTQAEFFVTEGIGDAALDTVVTWLEGVK